MAVAEIEVASEKSPYFRLIINKTGVKLKMEFEPLEKYSAKRKSVRGKRSSSALKTKLKGKEIEAVHRVKQKSKLQKRVTDFNDYDVSETEGEGPKLIEKLEEPRTKRKEKKSEIFWLFVNMKKKIVNLDEVMGLHSDIVSIRLPRKKCSRWCWAVFETQEKANLALKELKQRKDIVVAKPRTEEKRQAVRQKVLKKASMKKKIKNKLKNTWL